MSPETDVLIRGALPSDGPAVHALIARVGTLELNTGYAYLLLCDHFGNTSVLAERDGQLLGAVLGYRPPNRPDAVFVWQVGVDPAARGTGLGKMLLRAFARTPGAAGVRYLEATVAPSNAASRALFDAFARAENAPLEEHPGYGAPHLAVGHEPEPLLRIGPMSISPSPHSTSPSSSPSDGPNGPRSHT
jgi:L-2,4-diaminobutyric acid acetyltransferase